LQRASKKRPTIVALDWDVAPCHYMPNGHFDMFLDNHLLCRDSMALDAQIPDEDNNDDVEPASKTQRLHPLITMVSAGPAIPASKTTGRKTVFKK